MLERVGGVSSVVASSVAMAARSSASAETGAPTMDARRVNAVEDADLEAMVMGGHAFWIEGVARRDGQEVPFRWGLPVAVDNVRCVNGVDETDGLVIGEGGLSEAELTVHLDHLFFDSLASEEPGMRFEAMAAVAGEGPLTLEDLAAQSITDVRDAEGEPIEVEGAPLIYDPGDTPLEARDLRGFVLAAARTMATRFFPRSQRCSWLADPR